MTYCVCCSAALLSLPKKSGAMHSPFWVYRAGVSIFFTSLFYPIYYYCKQNHHMNTFVMFLLYSSFVLFHVVFVVGNFCEVNIDECISSPCLHNATCVDLLHGYECVCKLGFTGLYILLRGILTLLSHLDF